MLGNESRLLMQPESGHRHCASIRATTLPEMYPRQNKSHHCLHHRVNTPSGCALEPLTCFLVQIFKPLRHRGHAKITAGKNSAGVDKLIPKDQNRCSVSKLGTYSSNRQHCSVVRSSYRVYNKVVCMVVVKFQAHRVLYKAPYISTASPGCQLKELNLNSN